MVESKKIDNKVIVELIRLIDYHKRHLFKYYDVYRGTISLMLIAFIAILFLTEAIIIGDRYVLGTMTDVIF